jgi:hypothetical protein
MAKTTLSHLVPVAAAFNLMFSATVVVNSMQISYLFGNTGKWLSLVLISPSADITVLWLTYSVVLLSPWPLILKDRKAPPIALVASHIILPISLILVGGCRVTVAASYGLVASIATLYYAATILDLLMIRAISISGTTVGLAYVSISVIAASATLMDPTILYGWFGGTLDTGIPERAVQLDVNIFYSSYQLIGFLLLFFLFAWVWAPLPMLYQRLKARVKSARRSKTISRPPDREEAQRKVRLNSQRSKQARLLYRWLPRAGAALACLLGAYAVELPYLHSAWIHLKPIGVDAAFYTRILSETSTPDQLFALMVSEPRALYIALLYTTRSLTGMTTEATVTVGPAVLLVLLAAATYLFAAAALRDERLASLASALSVFSVQTTVGIYAGIYTNWLALAEVAVFYALLVMWTSKGRKRHLVGAILVSILLLFTHLWTWPFLLAALACQTLLVSASTGRKLKRARIEYRELFSVSMIAGTSITIAVLVMLYTSPSGLSGVLAGVISYSQLVKSVQIQYLANLALVLFMTLTRYVGGFFANGFLFALSILGAWEARRYSGTFQRVLFSWLLVSSILTVLIEPQFQWRVLFLVPYCLSASLGVHFLARTLLQYQARTAPSRTDSILVRVLVTVVVTAVLLALVNYTLRSVVFTTLSYEQSPH